jgi:hypothetical protein
LAASPVATIEFSVPLGLKWVVCMNESGPSRKDSPVVRFVIVFSSRIWA